MPKPNTTIDGSNEQVTRNCASTYCKPFSFIRCINSASHSVPVPLATVLTGL